MEAGSLLARYDEDIALLAGRLREFLHAAFPGLVEEVDAKANLIGFGFGPGYTGAFCTIIPSKKGVKLGIVRSAVLPDPEGLLEGTGRVHRYVVIRSEADLHRPALHVLLHLAAEVCRARIAQRSS